MDEIKCEVIRDLLPLYEDNAASEETQELVRKHLKDCPACREELRKMRTPISIPPEDDGDLWEKYTHRRAKLRRKRNIKIGCVVSALAILAVFCLCYTLIPRSWDSVSHGAQPDQIMGTLYFITHNNGEMTSTLWGISDEYQWDTEAISAFMDALQAGTYRAELCNVLNYTPLGGLLDADVYGSRGTLLLYLLKNNGWEVSIHLFDTDDHIVQITTNENSNTFFYHVNGELYDTLAALMEEYGVMRIDKE